MATLATLRQACAEDLDGIALGTADAGGSTTTIIDADLSDVADASSKYANAWLYITSGPLAGEVRKVTTYAPATGTFTVHRAWSAAPAAGVTFEVHTKLSPVDLNTRINRALLRCTYLDELAVTPVADQRQYSLAAYAYITRKEQVIDVLWRQGSTANEYRYLPLEWYGLRDDAGTLTLDIRPYNINTGDTLVIRLIRPYAELSTDASTTLCPTEWVKAGALLEVYAWLARNGPAQDSARYEAKRQEQLLAWNNCVMTYAPRVPGRVQLPETPQRGATSDIVSW